MSGDRSGDEPPRPIDPRPADPHVPDAASRRQGAGPLIERAGELVPPEEAGLQTGAVVSHPAPEADGASSEDARLVAPADASARLACALHALLRGGGIPDPGDGGETAAYAPVTPAGERHTPAPRIPAAVADEFRRLKNNVLQTAMTRGPGAVRRANMVLVASGRRREGRTFCAVNLALAVAAERDLSVLLVDADLRHPAVLERLRPAHGGPPAKGLLSIVSDPAVDFAECIVRTGLPNLAVLPAGRHKRLTAELIASERMAEVTGEIGRRYLDRIVIFDSPPALASPMAAALAAQVGQTLFVVAAERTRATDAARALATLEACAKVRLLLNGARYREQG